MRHDTKATRVLGIMVGVWLGMFPFTPFAAADGGGTITGTVSFSGTPPPLTPVNFGAEKQCALVHGTTPPNLEDIVVNSNGTVRDVLIYVAGEVPGTYTAPTEPLVFEQKGCIFLPHVGAVMVGQPVEVRNDDPVLHNVRAQSKRGQSFNIAQPIQGMKTTKVMKTQEIGIPLKCDVHFWMVAYLHALAHPFFAITGEDGTFAITGLPDGAYTLEAWHEKLGSQTQAITIQGGQTSPVEFVFKWS